MSAIASAAATAGARAAGEYGAPIIRAAITYHKGKCRDAKFKGACILWTAKLPVVPMPGTAVKVFKEGWKPGAFVREEIEITEAAFNVFGVDGGEMADRAADYLLEDGGPVKTFLENEEPIRKATEKFINAELLQTKVIEQIPRVFKGKSSPI